eukprot:scaffold677226_cov74-Prasinocladus_malaysianus.AAC.2
MAAVTHHQRHNIIMQPVRPTELRLCRDFSLLLLDQARIQARHNCARYYTNGNCIGRRRKKGVI